MRRTSALTPRTQTQRQTSAAGRPYRDIRDRGDNVRRANGIMLFSTYSHLCMPSSTLAPAEHGSVFIAVGLLRAPALSQCWYALMIVLPHGAFYKMYS